MSNVDAGIVDSVKKRPFCGCFSFAREYLRLFVLMLGAVVGVGFISGAEIYQFFARFENFSWIGIATFFILIFALVYKILSTNSNCKNVFKMYNIKQNCLKNTIYIKSQIKNVILFVCELLVAGAMFSGLKNLILNLLNNNYVFVFCVCVLFVFVLLLIGVRGLEKFNYFVLAMLIAVVCYIVFFGLDCAKDRVVLTSNVSFNNITSPIVFAVMYVFMNIVQIQAVSNALSIKFSKKKVFWFSFGFAVFLTLIVSVFVLFLNNNINYVVASMPLLLYFSNVASPLLKNIFVVGLFFGLLSALLSCLVGAKHTFGKRVDSNLTSTFVCVMLALLLGMIDFSVYVSVIYPIMGVVNFVVFVFL